MLLRALRDYASRLPAPPRLYSPVWVRYLIDLDGAGRLLTREPLDLADPSNRQARRGLQRLAPSLARAYKIVPLLLADKADYTLGYIGEGGKADRSQACHAAYLGLLRRCASFTGESTVTAVLTFLENDPLSQLNLPDGFDPTGIITFRVDERFPIDLSSVQTFWATENDPTARDAPTMQCLVCGQERPVLPRLESKVKGLRTGQPAGTSIISANEVAFESYGLKNSLIAPTCAACGEAFTNGVNALLAGTESHLWLGGADFVWWTREPVAFSLNNWFQDPQPAEVRELIDAARSGRPAPAIDDVAFFATILSGSNARAVVRDWIDSTLGQVKHRLADWFTAQAIVGEYGEPPRPLGLYALAAATVRDPAKELAPPTTRALLHAALTGAPVPWDLAARAVRRNVAERRVTRQRATLVKLVLARQLPLPEDAMVSLDPTRTEPAYHLGRLLAVLAEIQRQALGDVNANVVDRFYGTASSAPASVFQRLLGGARPHLSKLRRDRPGAHAALERRLEEIMDRVAGFPRVLVLPEQALFALGFYHQRAHDRAQAIAAAARRRAGATSTPDAPDADDPALPLADLADPITPADPISPEESA